MPIQAPCVVSLTWRLEDAQGRLIDELTEPREFFVGGADLLEKIEEALHGQDVGFEASVHLEPHDAFGEYDASLVCFEERSLFPQDVAAGMQIEGLPAGAKSAGMPADAVYTVTEVYPSHLVLDANHPLAGIALRLHLQVRDVREASDEEIEAGSVSDVPVSADAWAAGTTLH